VANHPSAEKRNRQRIKRTLRNRAVKSAVRTHVKNKKAATEALKAATVALDRASSKGVVPAKTASRTVSRLAAQVHKLG
jgi:small subunit ribosomal protein S20